MSKITIGVDLGTTNTCAAYVQDGIVKFLDLENNSLSMPSAVRFVDGKTDDVKIGRLAKRYAIVKPKEVFVSFKTLMQDNQWMNDPKLVEKYKIGGDQLTPTDIATRILAHIYQTAQSAGLFNEGEGCDIKICVPAASTPYYKNEVIKAAVKAGFGERDENGEVVYVEETIDGAMIKREKGISTIEEPFAAAYSYGMKNGFFDDEKSKDQNIMVYDFGGGTFDVSILNVRSEKNQKPEFRLLATRGVTRLGGDDVDMAIMKIAAKQFYKETQIDLINTDKDNKGLKKKEVLTAHAKLKELAEAAKIEDFAFGATESHLEQLAIIHDPEDDVDCNLDVIISREKFLEAIKPLLDKTIECSQNAIQESGITLGDINRFVLVGGSTKAPWVKEVVKEFAGKDPYVADNVDVIVGEGAALMSAYNAGEGTDGGTGSGNFGTGKPMPVNKTSQHYGVEVKGGFFIPLVVKGLSFDDEHPAHSGSIKCTNSNDSGTLYITGWATQEDVVEKDEDGNYVSYMSVHALNPDGEKMFKSIGEFRIDIPKAEPYTLDIVLKLTILSDNTLNLEVKVGDDEPFVQKW